MSAGVGPAGAVAQIEEAARLVRCSPLQPAVGMVMGSGLGAFGQTLERATHIPFG